MFVASLEPSLPNMEDKRVSRSLYMHSSVTLIYSFACLHWVHMQLIFSGWTFLWLSSWISFLQSLDLS